MRVLQLIDSLNPGGSERVAVTYANILSQHIDGSYLCATRAEGGLLKTINKNVGYIFLNKKRVLDFKAIKRLEQYVAKEKITVVHAHGSSYFIATILKLRIPSLCLIWHNHLGASKNLQGFKKKVLAICSKKFSAIIAVNRELVTWAEAELKTNKVVYLSNFISFSDVEVESDIMMKGEKGKRIVCLANLKNPKGHHFLIESFIEVLREVPEATLHLVGRDFNDTYSDSIKAVIKTNAIENSVSIYGLLLAPEVILECCDIGVLASSSEGLPMALLEYGKAELAVVATDVGYCSEVIKDNGIIVKYNDTKAMSIALKEYLVDKEKNKRDSLLYKGHIKTNYSDETIVHQVINLYTETLENI